MRKVIEDLAERWLIGEDPHHIERFFRRAYSGGFTQRPDVTIMGAVSALEMACWDIIGKEADKPVYELLGGRVHERLRSYTYLYPKPELGETSAIYWNAEASAERAAEYVAQGYTAVKFDPVAPYTSFDPRQLSLEQLDLGEKFVRLVREAVGSKADLLFGTHGQMTPTSAVRLAKRLEPYDPLWLEEPVPPDMPENMGYVQQHTSIPIAAGERLTTKYEFQRLLVNRAANILQMNLGRVGGILEAKKIAGMAETFHAQIAPHLYCGPIIGAANIQISTCSPNFLILECIQAFSGFHAEILKKPIHWENGYVIPSLAPGLGVELNEPVAEANAYLGHELHLNMARDPLVV